MYRTRFQVLTLFTLLTIGACSPDSAPTGPDDVAGTPAVTAEEMRLQAEVEAEWQRIDAESVAAARTYDSLMVVHDQLANANLVGTLGELVGNVTGLLLCRPLRYAADVQVVGPEGGVLHVGPHELRIPRGALTRKVVITGELPVSPAVTVRWSPHGLTFRKQPTLTLSYEHCTQLPLLRKRIVYTDELLKILEKPLSFDRPRDKEVDARIDHFSRYAIAF